MGNDLTVVDSSGHILIYSTGFALGQMVLVRPAANEQDGEMNSLVGLHWLPVFPHTQKVSRSVPMSFNAHLNYHQSGIYWSAALSEEDWKFRMSHHLSPGPYNPVEGKSALVCLTRSGVLRLLYQHRDGRWNETTADLEDSASTIDYSFTHASFAPDAGKFRRLHDLVLKLTLNRQFPFACCSPGLWCPTSVQNQYQLASVS